MKFLVTGGAGFIGSHLTEELLNRGDEVCVIDDLSTGSMDNVKHLEARPGFRRVVGTVLNWPLMKELVREADVVFHLAAAVGVRLIVESPVRTIETNIRGTEIVLSLAVEEQKTVVIFSTSEVYGKSSRAGFCETDDLILGPTSKGRWSYAASKIIDEFLALAYFKEKGLPVIIIRLFNTVGPRQTGRYGMVVPNFVRQALNREPITVYGDGKQTRSFTHVKDAVWAILKLVEHPGAVGEIFNIGGLDEITIEGLARTVKELLQSPSTIMYIPYEEAYEQEFEDMRKRAPNISKIERMIGYKPRYRLGDIIADVAEYQKQRASVARLGPTYPVKLGSTGT
jgi:nucleoside-diphosphate-sugar epimerase